MSGVNLSCRRSGISKMMIYLIVVNKYVLGVLWRAPFDSDQGDWRVMLSEVEASFAHYSHFLAIFKKTSSIVFTP